MTACCRSYPDPGRGVTRFLRCDLEGCSSYRTSWYASCRNPSTAARRIPETCPRPRQGIGLLTQSTLAFEELPLVSHVSKILVSISLVGQKSSSEDSVPRIAPKYTCLITRALVSGSMPKTWPRLPPPDISPLETTGRKSGILFPQLSGREKKRLLRHEMNT